MTEWQRTKHWLDDPSSARLSPSPKNELDKEIERLMLQRREQVEVEQKMAEIEDEIINSEIQRIRLKYADTSDDG